jgi:hypothetical protein
VRHGILKILVIALAILVLSSSILNLIQLPRVQASEENNQQQTCNCNLSQSINSNAAHHITVLGEPESPMIQIESLSLSNFTSCGCQSCGQTYDNIAVNTTILYQNETYVLTKITYTVNDTVYELLFEHAILYKYSEVSSGANKTLEFTLTKISGEGTLLQTYSLIYTVQHREYTLDIMTRLIPLDSQTYNSSFTVVRYATAGQNVTLSLEFVEFNMPVTLSQLYSVLSMVVDLLGNLYVDYVYFGVVDGTFIQLPIAYYTIKMELEEVADIVDLRLPDYNKLIMKSYVTILSLEKVLRCLGSILACIFVIAAVYYVILKYCTKCAMVVACLPACYSIFTFWTCLLCIATGIYGCLFCIGGLYFLIGYPPPPCYDAGKCLGIWK